MQFDVLTLFPEMFKSLDESIIGRAKEKGLININLVNINNFFNKFGIVILLTSLIIMYYISYKISYKIFLKSRK